MKSNISIPEISAPLSDTMQAIAPAARVAILIAIGSGESCVCHLEAVLGWRQAYISQHLMSLRQAGLLKVRKEGRFAYYSLVNEALLSLIKAAATLSEISPHLIDQLANPDPGAGCECPTCVPKVITLG